MYVKKWPDKYFCFSELEEILGERHSIKPVAISDNNGLHLNAETTDLMDEPIINE